MLAFPPEWNYRPVYYYKCTKENAVAISSFTYIQCTNKRSVCLCTIYITKPKFATKKCWTAKKNIST